MMQFCFQHPKKDKHVTIYNYYIEISKGITPHIEYDIKTQVEEVVLP
jgi:hypothetical protein